MALDSDKKWRVIADSFKYLPVHPKRQLNVLFGLWCCVYSCSWRSLNRRSPTALLRWSSARRSSTPMQQHQGHHRRFLGTQPGASRAGHAMACFPLASALPSTLVAHQPKELRGRRRSQQSSGPCQSHRQRISHLSAA